jgi:hypothetical protein
MIEDFTRAAEGQLGDYGQTAFFLGDGLQRAAVDKVFDCFSLQNLNPYLAFKKSTALLSELVHATLFFVPGMDSELQWNEIKNKLEVFVLVRNLSGVLGLSDRVLSPLSTLVGQAYHLDPFKALWAVEGVGHYYADRTWNLHGSPQALLSGESNLPTKSLLMLHAGIGLAFADRIVGSLHLQSSANEIRAGLQRFHALCERNSMPGYRGAALESLGLVTREFYPDLVHRLAPRLEEIDPELPAYFWHGVGRALYFSRAYFLPVLSSGWEALERESRPGPERENATAGLAWAATLVNMRQPPIMEGILRSFVPRFSLGEAVANGVGSAVAMREDTTPGEKFVGDFCGHRPRARESTLPELWQQCVASPCSRALNADYPALKRENSLERLFRFQEARPSEQ